MTKGRVLKKLHSRKQQKFFIMCLNLILLNFLIFINLAKTMSMSSERLTMVPQLQLTSYTTTTTSDPKLPRSTLMLRQASSKPKFGERLLPLRRIFAGSYSKRATLYALELKNQNNIPFNQTENHVNYADKNIDTLFATMAPLQQNGAEFKRADNIYRDEVQKDSIAYMPIPNNFMKLSTESFANPTGSIISFQNRTTAATAIMQRLQAETKLQMPIAAVVSKEFKEIPTHSEPSQVSHIFRQQPWVVPAVMVCALSVVNMLVFEIYALFRVRKLPLYPRQFLMGQTLLFGLFACACLGCTLAFEHSHTNADVIGLSIGLAYTIVFGSLLVRYIHLNISNRGFPLFYQSTLLIFIILIQAIVSVQFFLYQTIAIETVIGEHSPTITQAQRTNFTLTHKIEGKRVTQFIFGSNQLCAIGSIQPPSIHCKMSFMELFIMVTYIMLLIGVVAVLSVKLRNTREYNHESTLISLAAGLSIPIWFSWISSGFVVTDVYKDGCIAFGLLACSSTIFTIIFMPKEYRLLMGQKRFYNEYYHNFITPINSVASTISNASESHRIIAKHRTQTTSAAATTSTATSNSSSPFYNGIHYSDMDLLVRGNEKKSGSSSRATASKNPNVFFQQDGRLTSDMMY